MRARATNKYQNIFIIEAIASRVNIFDRIDLQHGRFLAVSFFNRRFFYSIFFSKTQNSA